MEIHCPSQLRNAIWVPFFIQKLLRTILNNQNDHLPKWSENKTTSNFSKNTAINYQPKLGICHSQLWEAVWVPFCIQKLLWMVLKTKVKIDFFAKMTRKHNNKQFFKKYSYKLPTKAWYLSFTTGRSRLSAILHPKTPSNGTKNESQNWLFWKNDHKTKQQAIFQKIQLKTTTQRLISVIHNWEKPSECYSVSKNSFERY